jgi:hypothetical protein
MTAHVMADDFLGVTVGSGGESAAGSRMRKLMDTFTARRQSSKARDRFGAVNQTAVDAYYTEQADEADDSALLVEEQEEPSVEAVTPDWAAEVQVDTASDDDSEYDSGLPPGGDDEDEEDNKQESVSDGQQNAEDAKAVMWDELTPLDTQRARTALGARREEMLARHAAEMQALDQEKAQVAGLADAIAVFVQRYASTGVPSAEASTEPSS